MIDGGVEGVGILTSPAMRSARPAAGRPTEFGGALAQALAEVNTLQHEADRAVRAYATGQGRDVAGTLIAVERAALSFQLAVQVRNKLLEAYQEVLRMPI
jgi:flagellar hook-basal body complex protein FliE